MDEPSADRSVDTKSHLSLYSNTLWNRLLKFFPSSNSSTFLGKISNFYHRTLRLTSRRRRRTCLPLPLPSTSHEILRAQGRGRIARLQRRLLTVEVEKRILQFQTFIDQGLEKDAQCMYGLVLYTLDRLYCAVERHAKATGEWQCLRQDIMDLAKPNLQTAYKLMVTSRMERVYDCLLPSSKR